MAKAALLCTSLLRHAIAMLGRAGASCRASAQSCRVQRRQRSRRPCLDLPRLHPHSHEHNTS